jgi:hypothetical protein
MQSVAIPRYLRKRELREAVDTGGGERHAVVSANGPRQAVLAKEAIENGPDTLALGRE